MKKTKNKIMETTQMEFIVHTVPTKDHTIYKIIFLFPILNIYI